MVTETPTPETASLSEIAGLFAHLPTADEAAAAGPAPRGERERAGVTHARLWSFRAGQSSQGCAYLNIPWHGTTEKQDSASDAEPRLRRGVRC